jgi:chitinase
MASLPTPRNPTAAVLSLMIALLIVQSLWAQTNIPRVVGYYPDWNKGSYPHQAVQYQNITHIAHAFLIPNADGSLSGTSGFAYPALVQTAHQAGVQVIVVLGGWGQSAGFSPMAADTAARRRFVENILSFCVTNSYDGVDLDWEYPANAVDSMNLTSLVRELRGAFSTVNTPLSISLAVPATNWSGRWFNVAGMKGWVDWFGIMTYDFYGSWTTKAGPNSALHGNFSTNTEGWVDYSFTYYTATRGLAAGQVVIGLPFYGWVFNAPTMYGPSSGAVQKTYAMIAPFSGQGWTRYWDSEGMVPYMINPSGTQTVSYDDTVSVRLKCEYARAKSTGGVMIWAIGQDYLSGAQPLLQTVGAEMGLSTSVPPLALERIPLTFTLEQNYPNPFNPTTMIRYELPVMSYVQLVVCDMLGREVAIIVNEQKPAGSHGATFNGAGLASGVYLCRLRAGVLIQTRKMLLVR